MKVCNTGVLTLLSGCLSCGAAQAALAADNGTEVEEIVTYGRAGQLVGSAQSASQGTVGYDDLRLRPLLRPGALAEAVPGMVATQHAGSGKANQYFLRGFNLDHGTHFSASLEGVPLNLRSHGHGQGYLDLNFLIPEFVEAAHYRKGPYYADTGDFSSAGNVRFDLYDELDKSIARVSIGEFGYRSALVAGNLKAWPGTLTAALDLAGYNGPWTLEEDLDRRRLYAGIVFPVAGGEAKVTLQGYSNEWRSTDQVPLREIESGRIRRVDPIDPDLGGNTARSAVTFSAQLDDWQFAAYLVDYRFGLYSNITYRLADPVNGDEFEQRDNRRIFGGAVQGLLVISVGSGPVTLEWSAELRVDDIGHLGLYQTAARERLNAVREDAVREASLGGWTEAK